MGPLPSIISSHAYLECKSLTYNEAQVILHSHVPGKEVHGGLLVLGQ
jgi:hypothetical protein